MQIKGTERKIIGRRWKEEEREGGECGFYLRVCGVWLLLLFVAAAVVLANF